MTKAISMVTSQRGTSREQEHFQKRTEVCTFHEVTNWVLICMIYCVDFAVHPVSTGILHIGIQKMLKICIECECFLDYLT